MGALQFNIDSERQIFRETFSWQVYLLLEFLPEICWEEISKEIFAFHISSRCLTWDLNFTSSKKIHYLVDYGDFKRNNFSKFLNNLLVQITSFNSYHRDYFLYSPERQHWTKHRCLYWFIYLMKLNFFEIKIKFSF